MNPPVFLFDLDGVLVQPLGYRAAVRATVNRLSRRMGLGDLAPDDETVAIFEAQGITCEWDMVPVLLAAVMESALATLGEPAELPTLERALDFIASSQMGAVSVDYAPLLRSLGRYVRSGQAPAESVLEACSRGADAALFPHLTGQGVLQELLTNTRRPSHSITTNLFQTYVLGDKVFSRSMGLPALVETESLLEKYDRPLLDAPTRALLLEKQREGALRMAAYTARPSLPFREDIERLAVYTPEAEMALQLVGLQGVAFTGSGQMGEAAWLLGESEDRLTKPALYHALAAIASAWMQDSRGALAWVEQVFRYIERGEQNPGLQIGASRLPDELALHVFEDSPSGMRGALEAASILHDLGCKVEAHLWGISEHPEKVAALAQAGATVFPTVNEAIRLVIRD